MPCSQVSVLGGTGGSVPALKARLFDMVRAFSPMMLTALIGMAAPSAFS